MIEGGCLCGAVRYRATGAPRGTTNCHCLHCRGSSGAPFLTWTTFDSSTFRFVSGSPARYSSRPHVTRQFCGACGTQLTWQGDEDPGEIDVTTCSFDDPGAVTPADNIWCDRMVPWLKLNDGLPRYRLRRQDG